MESRITHLTIQLLLLENLKKQPTTYQWEGALNAISLAKIDTLIDLLKKLHKEIQRFDDYHSLNWDEKKLSLSKIKLINYIEKVLEITKKSITTKFNFIKLDEEKINNQIQDNTFHLSDLENFLNESSFSILISNKIINYKDRVKKIETSESLPSKYLTTDYDITIDNLFRLSYYTLLIDSSIYEAINQDKLTEYYYENDASKLLLKIVVVSKSNVFL